MPKYKIMVARFPYGGVEETKCVDWLIKTAIQLKKDKRIGEILNVNLNDTPITMTRNKACRLAQKSECDLLLMVDNDMVPDYQALRPFLDSSLDFILKHKGPCMVAAPYCGPPPHENVYIFHWEKYQSDHPSERDFALKCIPREQAAIMNGIQEAAALPTGLLLMTVDCLDYVAPPWFYYEYSDEYETEKASTEDVVFTRNCSLAGVPVYCNWDSWAGHVKKKIVGQPEILRVDQMQFKAKKAKDRNIHTREVMVDFDEEKLKCPTPYGQPKMRSRVLVGRNGDS